MVGLDISMKSTPYTSPVISCKNSFAPFSVFLGKVEFFPQRSYATLPVPVLFSCQTLLNANLTFIPRSLISFERTTISPRIFTFHTPSTCLLSGRSFRWPYRPIMFITNLFYYPAPTTPNCVCSVMYFLLGCLAYQYCLHGI